MVFHVFIVIIFVYNQDTWMRMNSVTVMVFFFESGTLKVTLSQLYSKFFLNNYEAHGKDRFEDTLQVNNFRKWINISAKSFIKTSVNFMNKKSMKALVKKEKSKRVLWRTLIFFYYTLPFIWKLVFKFNIVLIGTCLGNFHHNLVTFLPFD